MRAVNNLKKNKNDSIFWENRKLKKNCVYLIISLNKKSKLKKFDCIHDFSLRVYV